MLSSGPGRGVGPESEEHTMSLTIDPVDLRFDVATEQPTAGAAPSVERWLEAMYGIRPEAKVRRTFVPMNRSPTAGVADWLHRMWGL